MGKPMFNGLLNHPLVDKFLTKLRVALRIILKPIGYGIIGYSLYAFVCSPKVHRIVTNKDLGFMDWAMIPSIIFFIILFIVGPYHCLINKSDRTSNLRQVMQFSFFPLVLWTLFFTEFEFMPNGGMGYGGIVFIPLLKFTQYIPTPYIIDDFFNIIQGPGMCFNNISPENGWNIIFWAFKASLLLIVFIIYHARHYREIVSYQKWMKVFFGSYLVFFLVRSLLFSLTLMYDPEGRYAYRNCDFSGYFSIVLPWGPNLSKDHCSYISSC